VLSDFGIAVPAHNTQSLPTQESAGTVLYMAPEQLRGKARPASDQYALGIVSYEWLSGACPFGGLTPIEIAMQHVLEPPPPLREHAANIPAEVEQVILRALAKEPQQRFATIEEFANALEQAYQPTLLVSIQSVVPIPLVESSPPPTEDTMSTTPIELLLTYHGHSKEVSALAWSPDGSRIVSGGRDEMAQVWDTSTHKHILTYHGHFSTDNRSSTVGISTVAWSPNGMHIASAGNDQTTEVWNGTVHIWEATTGEHILTYGSHFGSVRTVAWSPNSTYIASLGAWDNTINVWDAFTGRHVLTYNGHAGFVHQIAWSPDGTYIASGSDDKTVQIWNASTGVQIKTYTGHSKSVATVTWSPNGTHIASASSDGTIHVWNSSTGKEAWRNDTHSDHSWPDLRWSPDGKYLVSSGRWNSTVEIWEASTGKLALTYRGHSGFVKAIAWSPDGSCIASGDSQGIVQVWQAASIPLH
jgi:WD40 repeat protein